MISQPPGMVIQQADQVGNNRVVFNTKGNEYRLVVLVLLVEHYEKRQYPIDDVDPIELIEHVMQSRDLSRKDLEPMIGPRGRVANILNRTRPLTLEMIRRLVTQLQLPSDVLVRPYALREARVAA